MKTIIYSIMSIFIITFLSPMVQAQNIEGFWKGEIKFLGQKLEFSIKVKTENNSTKATMDIPLQGLANFPLKNFSFVNPKIHFEIHGGAGIAKFDGELKADSINGTFAQAGIKGDYSLIRSEEVAFQIPKDDIDKDLPYLAEEVNFKNGNLIFAGTLTLPNAEGIFPAAILLTGSGPQNRDEDVFGFKVFKKIADHLTRNGIAVLRYDDRGVGGSTGNTMGSTTEDFAHDAVAAVNFLKTRKEIDKSKIGLIGHSEGGIAAPLAATISNDIAYLVLISGTGVPGNEILLEQQRLILKASNVTDEFINKNLNLQKQINEYLITGKDLNELKGEIRKLVEIDFNNLSDEMKKSIQDKEAYIDANVNVQTSVYDNNWFRFFIKYDPAPALENLQMPVLMTFGELDLQVSAEQNKSKMEEALKRGGNKNFKSIVYPKANHLYQEAKTGSPGEYNNLPKEFVPGFLDEITKWIKDVIKY